MSIMNAESGESLSNIWTMFCLTISFNYYNICKRVSAFVWHMRCIVIILLIFFSLFRFQILTKNRLCALFSNRFTALNSIRLTTPTWILLIHCSVQNDGSGHLFTLDKCEQQRRPNKLICQNHLKPSSIYLNSMANSEHFCAR